MFDFLFCVTRYFKMQVTCRHKVSHLICCVSGGKKVSQPELHNAELQAFTHQMWFFFFRMNNLHKINIFQTADWA